MNKDIVSIVKGKILLFDGGIGTEIYKRNFFVNQCFEELCLSSPKVVEEIHSEYLAAGADIITANSFAANRLKLSRFGLAEKIREINQAAVAIAQKIAGENALIAASIGPAGKKETNSKIKNSDAIVEQALILSDAGADLLLFETLSCLNDVKNAVSAASETSAPFIISFTVDENGESFLGESLEILVETAMSGKKTPSLLGLNCGLGPDGILLSLEKLLRLTNIPLLVRPNGGMPKDVDGRMIYMTSPEYFSTYALRFVQMGARAVGGCCGTGPEHIREMARALKPMLKAERSLSAKINVVLKDEEKKLMPPVPTEQKSKFAAKLSVGNWVTSIEIVPPKGYDLSQTVEKAKICKNAGIDAINIPDGPRASCRISPLVTAFKIQSEAAIEVILHFCCRDRNLIGMQADLLGCASLGINNLLFVTGDPPKLGDYPFASGVFDADSIVMAGAQSMLNRGIDVGGKSINCPTKAFIGIGTDPNALDLNRELRRTKEKVDAGAEFIITQPVFATASLLAFIQKIRDLNINLPVVAGIWPLASIRNAEFMKNEVPGVIVPDEIIQRMSRYENKEDQRKEGISIAEEIVGKIKNSISGIQVSAPFGNVLTSIELISRFK
jgi:homocysteine S-methyltransferase